MTTSHHLHGSTLGQVTVILHLNYSSCLSLASLFFSPAFDNLFSTQHPDGGSLVTKLCSTLADPMDCSLPGSSVHGILQARILEWIAISFSRGSSQPRSWTQVSCIVGRFFTNWHTREAQQPKEAFENFCLTDYGGLVTKSCLTLETPWTVAYQARLSMGFSKQKYWTGLPFPSPGDFPDPGIKPQAPGLLDCRQILYWLSYEGSPMDYTSKNGQIGTLFHFAGHMVWIVSGEAALS